METINIPLEKGEVDFDAARMIAQTAAKRYNSEASLMAWFDRKRNKHSPSEVECSAAGFPGWEEYGRHHGGEKKIIIGNGDYVFIYT